MCAITMVFNSSWKPLFHIEVTAAEEDGGKEEGKRLRGGGDWTILDDDLMKNRWGRQLDIIGCRLGRTLTLLLTVAGDGSSWLPGLEKLPPLQKLISSISFSRHKHHHLHYRQCFLTVFTSDKSKSFVASSVTWRWTGSPTHSGFSSSLWWNILNWKRRDQSLW